MTKIVLLVITVVFFAVNMGASGIAPSFAAACGSKLIGKRRAILLFTLFVTIGAVLLGGNVAKTLGSGLLPKGSIDIDVVLAILGSAAVGLFIANIFKIPQSTSQVTVGAIVGAGLFLRHINLNTVFLKIIPMWIILPALSYILTLLLYKRVYPPGRHNLHIYQKVFANAKRLQFLTQGVSCYVAFAIGSNNVANAVGPLSGAGIIDVALGLVAISPLFGLGAFLLGKGPLDTAGHEIVPLGLVSSALVSFVTATLLIIASIAGVPQSLVQLNIFSIFAISCLKNGHRHTMDYHVTKKTLRIWVITPVLATGISYILLALLTAK